MSARGRHLGALEIDAALPWGGGFSPEEVQGPKGLP